MCGGVLCVSKGKVSGKQRLRWRGHSGVRRV